MTTQNIYELIKDLEKISSNIISLSEIDFKSIKNQGLLDVFFEKIYRYIVQV